MDLRVYVSPVRYSLSINPVDQPQFISFAWAFHIFRLFPVCAGAGKCLYNFMQAFLGVKVARKDIVIVLSRLLCEVSIIFSVMLVNGNCLFILSVLLLNMTPWIT